jgi:hypothetical protein
VFFAEPVEFPLAPDRPRRPAAPARVTGMSRELDGVFDRVDDVSVEVELQARRFAAYLRRQELGSTFAHIGKLAAVARELAESEADFKLALSRAQGALEHGEIGAGAFAELATDDSFSRWLEGGVDVARSEGGEVER